MGANKTEEKNFSILAEQGEIHTKKVTELTKITLSVTSKYLELLGKKDYLAGTETPQILASQRKSLKGSGKRD